VVSWLLVYTKQAKKDAKRLSHSGLKPQAERLLDVLRDYPYRTPPPYERLVGDLTGGCSRKTNIQHRIVYQILNNMKTVKIIRMWTHYE
jgi:Txe/YoeB family toxin of toxin-antitoxin system